MLNKPLTNKRKRGQLEQVDEYISNTLQSTEEVNNQQEFLSKQELLNIDEFPEESKTLFFNENYLHNIFVGTKLPDINSSNIKESKALNIVDCEQRTKPNTGRTRDAVSGSPNKRIMIEGQTKYILKEEKSPKKIKVVAKEQSPIQIYDELDESQLATMFIRIDEKYKRQINPKDFVQEKSDPKKNCEEESHELPLEHNNWNDSIQVCQDKFNENKLKYKNVRNQRHDMVNKKIKAQKKSVDEKKIVNHWINTNELIKQQNDSSSKPGIGNSAEKVRNCTTSPQVVEDNRSIIPNDEIDNDNLEAACITKSSFNRSRSLMKSPMKSPQSFTRSKNNFCQQKNSDLICTVPKALEGLNKLKNHKQDSNTLKLKSILTNHNKNDKFGEIYMPKLKSSSDMQNIFVKNSSNILNNTNNNEEHSNLSLDICLTINNKPQGKDKPVVLPSYVKQSGHKQVRLMTDENKEKEKDWKISTGTNKDATNIKSDLTNFYKRDKRLHTMTYDTNENLVPHSEYDSNCDFSRNADVFNYYSYIGGPSDKESRILTSKAYKRKQSDQTQGNSDSSQYEKKLHINRNNPLECYLIRETPNNFKLDQRFFDDNKLYQYLGNDINQQEDDNNNCLQSLLTKNCSDLENQQIYEKYSENTPSKIYNTVDETLSYPGVIMNKVMTNSKRAELSKNLCKKNQMNDELMNKVQEKMDMGLGGTDCDNHNKRKAKYKSLSISINPLLINNTKDYYLNKSKIKGHKRRFSNMEQEGKFLSKIRSHEYESSNEYYPNTRQNYSDLTQKFSGVNGSQNKNTFIDRMKNVRKARMYKCAERLFKELNWDKKSFDDKNTNFICGMLNHHKLPIT